MYLVQRCRHRCEHTPRVAYNALIYMQDFILIYHTHAASHTSSVLHNPTCIPIPSCVPLVYTHQCICNHISGNHIHTIVIPHHHSHSPLPCSEHTILISSSHFTLHIRLQPCPSPGETLAHSLTSWSQISLGKKMSGCSRRVSLSSR